MAEPDAAPTELPERCECGLVPWSPAITGLDAFSCCFARNAGSMIARLHCAERTVTRLRAELATARKIGAQAALSKLRGMLLTNHPANQAALDCIETLNTILMRAGIEYSAFVGYEERIRELETELASVKALSEAERQIIDVAVALWHSVDSERRVPQQNLDALRDAMAAFAGSPVSKESP